jgi:hypothetical protein
MLNSGKDLAAVLQTLEISESTLERWRAQFGGMKCEKAKSGTDRPSIRDQHLCDKPSQLEAATHAA